MTRLACPTIQPPPRCLAWRPVLLVTLVLGLLTGCGGGRKVAPTAALPVDAELRNLANAAQASLGRGDLDLALDQFLRAWRRARLLDEPLAIGNQAYNLAICHLVRREPQAALPYLREAAWELARAGEPLADVWLTEARVLWQVPGAGGPAAAQAVLARLASDPRAGLQPAHRVQMALLQAEMALADTQLSEAEALLVNADRHLGKTPTAGLLAARARVAGKILLARGQPALAAQQYDAEVVALTLAQRLSELPLALQRAGAAHEAAGDLAAAAARYYRAARIVLTMGDTTQGQPLATRASQLAEQAGDGALAALARALLATPATRTP